MNPFFLGGGFGLLVTMVMWLEFWVGRRLDILGFGYDTLKRECL